MIEGITLSNFKCFQKQRIPVRPLTLLTGLNGMGKSSTLQALLLLRQSHQQGLLREKGLALNGDLVCVGKGTDALFEGAAEDFIGFEIEFDNPKATAVWQFAYNREADVIGLVSSTADEAVFERSLFTDSFSYLHAERSGPRTSFGMSEFNVRQHRQIGIHGEHAAHFLAVFGRDDIKNDRVLHERAESRKLRDQVEAWLGEISPGTRIKATSHGTMDLVSLEYAFVSGQDVSAYFRSTNVGFGITYTLPVLVALLSASPGGAILIENPEAHLHPRGQTKMGELIARVASAGIQVIVETHSDHVLNGVRLSVRNNSVQSEDVAVHFFERKSDEKGVSSKLVSPNIKPDGRLDIWPNGFFDEWDRTLELLLTPTQA
jgi:predicted ATPase